MQLSLRTASRVHHDQAVPPHFTQKTVWIATNDGDTPLHHLNPAVTNDMKQDSEP